MLKKAKLFIVALASVFAISTPALAVYAQTDPSQDIQDNACQGINLNTSNSTCNEKQKGEDKVIGIIKTIINVLSLIVGAICVIMIIFGGFRYMTSGGESSGVSGAKNTILYAVVGLVVVLLAQAIVRFVFTRTTSNNVTTGP